MSKNRFIAVGIYYIPLIRNRRSISSRRCCVMKILCCVAMLCLAPPLCSAFVLTKVPSSRSLFSCACNNELAKRQGFSTTLLQSSSSDSIISKGDTSILDKNGNDIVEGTVIRLIKERKAYQVPAKAYGSYDVEKKFVPAQENCPRKERNLLLPVGMKGVVIKIYTSETLSPNFPIQVCCISENVQNIRSALRFSPEQWT
jgi:hypothetical protein